MSKLFNSFYWRLAGSLFGILSLLGIAYIFITAYYSRRYFDEVHQRLNAELAQYTVDHTNTFREDGTVDTTAIQDIMHSMMVINPSVEVYLLDPKGNIITYVVPKEQTKLESVDIAPIKTFLADKTNACIQGDDPKAPKEQRAFSAAPIMEDGELKGYYYIILASQKQGSVANTIFDSLMLQAAVQTSLIALLGTLFVALFVVWLLTSNLRNIIDIVRRFKEGDHKARIRSQGKGELTVLGDTFDEMADTIEQNIDDLKSVERLRRELIANVSHDLRTPLSIMQGYAETMLIKSGEMTEEEERKYLTIIQSSAEKMNRMVQQLFEYSKLEARQIQPQKEPFFLSELAQDILHKYEIVANEKEINLQLKSPEQLPLVFADIAMVERVFQNLIDNAIKFTPKGGEVILSFEPNNSAVEVRVTDSGPGIPKEEQAYIFERYHRVKTGEAKAYSEGTGLGLAIVKKILEIHNATIEVISNPNKGASFRFSLPIAG